MSGLCKVNFPLFCCHYLNNETFIVAGGGGAAKTGVKNAVEVMELVRQKKSCVASSIDQLDTGKDAVMSLSISSIQAEKWRLAASRGNKCTFYDIEKKTSQSNSDSGGKINPGLKQRKPSPSIAAQSNDQGVANYKFKKTDEFNVVPGEGGFQTCVKLSVDGTLVVSGASDGRVRLWNIPQKKLIFDVSCNESEVADIDMSFDSKQIVAVTHDGKAFLFDSTGNKSINLHLLWNVREIHQEKFRNCRFGIVPESRERAWIFTSHCPSKPDLKKKANGCLVKWSKKLNKERKEAGDYLPAIVQDTGAEPISTIALSRNGIFLGVGFMEGSVAIYISFSLQCAQRVRNVHSIFVTSLTFLEDTHRVRAITGECDAALVSVSADCTSHLTKLGSRAMFSLWFCLLVCFLVLVAVAIYLYQAGAL